MARTIKEIKDAMAATFCKERAVISAYGLNPQKEFSEQFSAVSIESVLFYVFAFAVWSLETLFDLHRADVDARIERLEPHTLRWYVNKTKAFMYGYKLVEDADYYDTSAMNETEISKAQVVKYAVATESNTVVYIKVAGHDEDTQKPCLLNESVFAALKSYINTVKDAGVSVKLINDAPDKIAISLVVYYDPTLLTAGGLDSEGKKPVDAAVQSVITNLPFNGVYRNTDLLAAVKELPSVEVVDIKHVRTKPDGTDTYSDIVGFHRPHSGYYEIESLDVEYIAYDSVEQSNDD